MQFALICRDAPNVLQRRLAARAEHMQNIHTMKKSGSIIDGGAILDDDRNMIGSVVLCEFPDRETLDTYLKSEVYAREGIWGEIEIIQMKRVAWSK